MRRRRSVRRMACLLALAGLLLPVLWGFGPADRVKAWLDVYAGNQHYRKAARAEARGDTEGRQREAAEAARLYSSALEAAPAHPQAAFNLGLADAMQGNLEGAYEKFSRAADAAANAGDAGSELRARYNAGTASLMEGDRDQGLPHLQRAAQLAPNDPSILQNLTWKPPDEPDQGGGGGQGEQEQEPQEQQQDPSPRDQNGEGQQDGGAPPPAPEQDTEDQPLNRDQAEQLLNSLAREDADIQKIIRRAPSTPPRATDRDW